MKVVAVALLIASVTALPAQSQQSEDTKSALRAQADRAGVIYKRGRAVHYTKEFDLSGLPHYEPQQILTGWVRLHGNNYLSDGMLGELWQQGFAKYQPGIRLSYYLPTSALAFAALYYDQADVVMGHRPGFYDLLAYERVKSFDPSEFTVVTGSFDVGGWENSLTILVNQDNPIRCINMEQLDGIFGSQRTGGWAGTNWRQDWARGADKDIRTWGQLGLTGEWADKPIHAGGQNLSSGAMLQFSNEVLGGSLQFVEGFKTYTNYITADGKMNSWSVQVQREVAKDRYAMFYASPLTLSPDMKELAIQAREGGPFVKRTLETVRDNSYPLMHHAFFYLNRKRCRYLYLATGWLKRISGSC